MRQAERTGNEATHRRRLHDPVPVVGQWLRSVVSGPIRYYGVPMNTQALHVLRFRVAWLWHRALLRRSQTGFVSWERMRSLIRRRGDAAPAVGLGRIQGDIGGFNQGGARGLVLVATHADAARDDERVALP